MPSQRTITTVPADQIQTIACPNCHTSLQYYTVPKQFPQLYCTHCHNAYVDTAAQDKCLKVRTDGGAAKVMTQIYSIAPLCSCGGMFLFTLGIHCVHCGEILPLTLPQKTKHRLLYDRLIVFHNTTVTYSDDKEVSYKLKA